MEDVYQYAREKGMLTTPAGYIISYYEFSKIIHSTYEKAMRNSIQDKKPYELFENMICYPVTTTCTRYIPRRNRKAVENGVEANIDVLKRGFKFSFLFLSTIKRYRCFKFTTAKKIKNIIVGELEKGEQFLDITMNEKVEYLAKKP